MGLNYMPQIIILVFSMSVTVLGNENSQLYVPCKPGWYFFGEKCYKLLRTQPRFYFTGLDWETSKFECQHFGGHLASIHSHELQEFITVFLLLNEKTSAWIGLSPHDNETRRSYYWEDGSMYNYTNWYRDDRSWDWVEEPCIVVHYGTLYRNLIGKWKILPCRFDRPYICQVNKNDDENSPDPSFCSLEEGGGWKYLNSCYHIVKEEKSWEDAEKYCEERYTGYLVSVLDDDSEQFQNYIQRLSNLTENVWIGIKMRNNSMQKWSSGWHVAYKKWNQERLHFVNGTCALKSNGSWSVVPCHSKYPFICEKLMYNVPVLKRPPSDDWKCPNSSKKWLDLEGEFCYYIETQNLKNWTEANNECRKIGGFLASFHSEDETNILHPHVLLTRAILLIGLKRNPENNDAFEWEDGTEVIYRNWEAEWMERPRYCSQRSVECAELWSETMKWRINSCDLPQEYICKSKKGSIPVGTVVGIVFCTFLVLVLFFGVIVYHSQNAWNRYCMKTENDGFTSAALSLRHMSEKVIWKKIR